MSYRGLLGNWGVACSLGRSTRASRLECQSGVALRPRSCSPRPAIPPASCSRTRRVPTASPSPPRSGRGELHAQALHRSSACAEISELWRATMLAEIKRQGIGNLTGQWDYTAVGPDPWSTHGVVEYGSVVKIDVGCVLSGYSSDSRRVPSAAAAPAHMRAAFMTGCAPLSRPAGPCSSQATRWVMCTRPASRRCAATGSAPSCAAISVTAPPRSPGSAC